MPATLAKGRKIPARLGMPGIHRDRIAELLRGFVGSTEPHENHTQLIMERGTRLLAERGSVIRRGFVQLPLFDQVARQVVVGWRVLRIRAIASRNWAMASSTLPCLERTNPKPLWVSAVGFTSSAAL